MKTQHLFTQVLLISAILILISGCVEKPVESKKTSPIRVKAAIADTIRQSHPVTGSGRLASKTEARLSFKTRGIIRNIFADEGQSVKKGTLLASLDLSEIHAQVAQAELAFEKAQRDFRRTGNLFQDSVATLEKYQDAKTALEVAKSNLEIAKFNLQHSEIIAPSDGRILKKLASENELIGSGMPVFIFAPTNNPMVVRVNLTDRNVIAIEMGDSASISFDAWPNETFSAEVTEIANAADPYTGTYEVELELDPADKKLLSGFIASVQIIPSKVSKFVYIPIEAMVEGRGRHGYVFAVGNNRPEKKQILISRIDNSRLILEKGLQPGDTVIVDGAQYVDESSEIEIEPIISNNR